MKIRFVIVLLICLNFAGCANFNPRNQPRINNQSGKIEEIKKFYSNFDELMDEAKELAKQGKLVEEEIED